jgi:23S rRNA (adenine2030-N6)-methyltransferase
MAACYGLHPNPTFAEARAAVNYRHAFHAGNFADLAKHCAIMLLLDRMLAQAEPLRVVDTHAGAGLYDLASTMALKSGEAEAGVFRLMADEAAPRPFDGLKRAVRRLNPKGLIQTYPGSPILIAQRLRPGDAYIGAELHPEDVVRLGDALAPFEHAQAVHADGYDVATECANGAGRLFILIDPPFERADDYARTADLASAVLRRNSKAVLAIWAPLKDLETLDAFVRRLEAGVDVAIDVAEVRLNRLDNPLTLNGCVMIFLNAPQGLIDLIEPALDWIATPSRSPGATARIWRAGG